MGDVLAWLEAAQADVKRAQRNLPASATSPTAGGESVALAASGRGRGDDLNAKRRCEMKKPETPSADWWWVAQK